MFFENIKNALRTIRSAKLRSFLTMLGIIIGVYAVITMISIGDGVKSQVGKQVSDLGTNILTVTSGQVLSSSSGNQRRSPSFNPAAAAGSSTLTNADVQTVEKTDNVVKTAAINLISSSISAGQNSTSSAFVLATNTSYKDIRGLNFSSGSFFSEHDEASAASVAVLGNTTKQTLFGDAEAVGQTVLIRNKVFRVVGVVKASDTGLSFGPSSDDVVYLPLSTGNQLAGNGTISTVYRIVTQVNDANNVSRTKDAITAALKANHGDQIDFSVLTQEDLVGAFGSILDILTSFVIAIASISLLVGGIGIMNIMLVSVTERTREIGIRKAIGATSGNILWQFLIESIILSLIGGVIGVALSYANTEPIKRYAKITPVFSWQAILLAVGVAFAVGMIFGVVPAIKAARKRPIQALKAL